MTPPNGKWSPGPQNAPKSISLKWLVLAFYILFDASVKTNGVWSFDDFVFVIFASLLFVYFFNIGVDGMRR